MDARTRRRLAHQASFLHERSAIHAPLGGERRARAEARLRLWREGALADDAVLVERLGAAGISREELLSMLADEHGDGDAGTSEAPWLASFDTIARACETGDDSSAGDTNPAGALPFARFVDPFVQTGRDLLRAALASQLDRSSLRLGPAVAAARLRDLSHALVFEATRTLVLELNVARLRGQLRGESPQERLACFSVRLADPEVREALLREYPVLARVMTTTVERWLATTVELLRRLADDWSSVEARFGGGAELGALVGLHAGLSDPHRHGRTVAVLVFESGVKLVYKPKSLAVDVEFQKLLGWVNTIGLRLQHRTLEVLDRGDHGWVEFAEQTSCDRPEAVRDFYFRQGSLLALLYVLKATDMHFENVVAAGAHPILVDLETLFHHRRSSGANPSAGDRVLTAIQESVFSVGLLPVFALERGPAGGVDFSALGGRAGQRFPHPVPVLENLDDDTMRFVQKNVTTVGASNRPRLNDEPIDAAPHADMVVEGFVETYARLVEERSSLMARLDAFGKVEVRHVVRPTFHYAFLLNAALHPDFLRDGLDQERALNRLWSHGMSQPSLREIVSFERRDLLLGDVPLFTAQPGSRDLWSSHGERIPDFFPQASLDACKQRLALMGERDCAVQVKLLRMSLRALQ